MTKQKIQQEIWTRMQEYMIENNISVTSLQRPDSQFDISYGTYQRLKKNDPLSISSLENIAKKFGWSIIFSLKKEK